ncbi:MAG: AbrB/MazE/SpoVT family DNA-binding domain-containing protein, partial [Deltaproteobacteria bacterium]
IGKSNGIRIPKDVLEQTGLKGEVELVVKDRQILIRGVDKIRDQWGRKFRTMAEKGDDKPLDIDAIGLSSWDEGEWAWS